MTALSVSSMRTDAFAAMPYRPAVRDRVQDLKATWEAFLALPERNRARLRYCADNLVGGSGSGYEPPSPAKPDSRKHTFHAKLVHREWLLGGARAVGHPAAFALVETALAFLEDVQPHLREFADAFAREFGDPSFPTDLDAGFDECVVRLLWYPPGYTPGEDIAKQHVDKGGGTLHLFETEGGVERLAPDSREWVPFPVGDGQAVVFSGLRMQHRTRCATRALCHRVRATEVTAMRGRLSGVLFLNFARTPYYDKANLGSTQGHEAGWNYDLSFEDFHRSFAHREEAA
jgi:isopenicillin N synthase-like dioxygenase